MKCIFQVFVTPQWDDTMFVALLQKQGQIPFIPPPGLEIEFSEEQILSGYYVEEVVWQSHDETLRIMFHERKYDPVYIEAAIAEYVKDGWQIVDDQIESFRERGVQQKPFPK